MVSYIESSDVSAELNGLSITSSTTPTTSTVENWIDDASEYINDRTDKTWSISVASSETYDYDGSGILKLNHTPIISITELLAESNGVNASSEGWYSLTEGRLVTQDFIKYPISGEVEFHGTKMPRQGFQNLKVSYTYGYTTTPRKVKMLCAKIVARRLIQSVINNAATDGGGAVSIGNISIQDPSMFGINHIQKLGMEIEGLFSELKGIKTYSIGRR